jgi:DNA-binding transcriptional LysR family regulator
MNFQQLSTFVTVVSEGSMTAAAEKLFLTQPAVSQQIRNLEEEIGSELLVRGVRKVKPTLQGQLLYDYSKRILQLTQQAQVAMQAMSTELVGDIRLGTLNSLGLYLLSPIIGLFLKHNSKLNFKLNYGSTPQLIEDLKKNEIDLAILPEPNDPAEKEFFSNFGSKFILSDEMWLVGSGKDMTLPQTIKLEEFITRPIVFFSDKYLGFQEQLDSKLDEQNLKFHPVFQSDNVGTLKRVVESGLGWGFLPSHSIHKQVRAGRLQRVMVDDIKFSSSINLYYRNDPSLNELVEVLFRALRQQVLT